MLISTNSIMIKSRNKGPRMECRTDFNGMPDSGQAVMHEHKWSVNQASANTKLDLPIQSSHLVTQQMRSAEATVNTMLRQQMLQPADMEWQTHSLLHTSVQL